MGGRGGFGLGGGDQGRCEQRSEVFVKIQKKKICWGGEGGGVRSGGGLEVEIKKKKKFFFGGGGGRGFGEGGGAGMGIRVDVNEELKFL